MTDRRPLVGVAVAVVLVGAAVRSAPLYWSPLPATLDGYVYAALVERTLAAGGWPWPVEWDALGWTAVLGAASAVTGVEPLVLAQPLTALLGGLACLPGVALARRVALERGWPADRARLAAALAGLALAAEGLYARRTGVPDEEVLTLLLLPALAYVAYRAVATPRPGRLALAALLGLAVVPTHALSALLAALTVTGVAAAAVAAAPGRRRFAAAAGLAGGLWGALAAYYLYAAGSPLLALTYVDRLLRAPGLFLAWAIVLVAGVLWVRGAGRWTARAALWVVFGGGFALLALNALLPVYPGTVPTPDPVLAAVLPLAVPALLAGWAFPGSARRGTGLAVLGLLAAPLALVGYALTAGLTAPYFDTLLRTQTFAHLPVLVLAALAVAGAGRTAGAGDGSRIAPGVVAVLLLASAAASAPLAVMALDTGAVPATMSPAAFEATAFAGAEFEGWTSERPLVRLGRYHGANGTPGPAATWLRGGPPPPCPAVLRSSWATTGASFFPGPPATLPADEYDAWVRTNDVRFSAGADPRVLVVRPVNGTAGCRAAVERRPAAE